MPADRRQHLKSLIRGLLTLVSALVALFLIAVAIGSVADFISPDTGNPPGSAGHLFVAAFYLVLAGPFVAITVVLAKPFFIKPPASWKSDRP